MFRSPSGGRVWPRSPCRLDGSLGMAARCPPMTRPLIETYDIDPWVRTCRRGYRQGQRKLELILLSKRVENDEIVLLNLIATIADIADIADIAAGGEVCRATDLNAGGAALLIELLAAHAQQLLHIPGRIVHHAAATYRGDGKTDAKDAWIIADQARMRTDLQPVRGADQISVDLGLLTARRTDLICDRVRAINRLRATLEYFPALERAFDYSKKAPLILSLGGYQTPEGIRRIGLTRLAGWLRKRGCRNSAKMAEKALKAARPSSPLPGAASTSSGPCSAIKPSTRNQCQGSALKLLDRNIEIPSVPVPSGR